MTPEERAIEQREALYREINESNPHGPQLGAETGWGIECVGIGGMEWFGGLGGLFKREGDAVSEALRYAVYDLHGCAIRVVHYRNGVPEVVRMVSDCRTLYQRWVMRKRNKPASIPDKAERWAEWREWLLRKSAYL